MDKRLNHLAEHVLGKPFEDLGSRERKILVTVGKKQPISRDLSQTEDDSLGARVADKVAAFGGSWTFIGLFLLLLLVWVGLNGWLLTAPPDPFPFIFLNLVLSMVAAFQAPIIMMSQNRQAQKDRVAAAHDYEVNLKSEIEIMRLHEKIDDLRMVALEARFDRIEHQLALLRDDIRALRPGPGTGAADAPPDQSII